ncbi:MAG: ABC transporter ATP-binding protein [Planctomycetota bacterium]
MNAAPILEVRSLAKSFGGVTALDGVSFRMAPGEALAVIGPNGSGKTTLINCISGFVRPTAGQVLFRGTDITNLAPHRVADRGIARTFQLMRPFHSLSTAQNLVIPLSSSRARRRGGWRGGGRLGDRDAVAIDILEELGFERDSHLPRQRSGTLPTGYLKRLELGRCIALRPDVVLCDELFSGLSISETASLVPFVERLGRQGIAFLMVGHRLREIFRLVSRVIVLARGRLIAEGTPAAVLDDAAVREAYLGSEEWTA